MIVELYNRDYKTWQRQQTFVNGTGMWVESYNTSKYQYRYGSSGDLYYTKTLINFKKTSSSPPIFVYFTVHFDDNGGDMSTYPKEYKNQVYIVAYGVVGLTDHVMHQSIPAAPIPPRANPRALALFLFWVANSRGWG